MTVHKGDVIRDATGVLIVDPRAVLLTVYERRRLLAMLDSRSTPRGRTRTDVGRPLLYGLLSCASCGRTLHRHAAGQRSGKRRSPRNTCPAGTRCPLPASVMLLETGEYVAAEFLAVQGRHPATEQVLDDSAPANTDRAAIEDAILDTTAAMALPDANIPALVERLTSLRAARGPSVRPRGADVS